jgi:hypothetical protein
MLDRDHEPLLHAVALPPSSEHRYPAAPCAENAIVAVLDVVATLGPDVIVIDGGGLKYGSAAMARNDASDDGELSTHRSHPLSAS